MLLRDWRTGGYQELQWHNKIVSDKLNIQPDYLKHLARDDLPGGHVPLGFAMMIKMSLNSMRLKEQNEQHWYLDLICAWIEYSSVLKFIQS